MVEDSHSRVEEMGVLVGGREGSLAGWKSRQQDTKTNAGRKSPTDIAVEEGILDLPGPHNRVVVVEGIHRDDRRTADLGRPWT